MSRPKLNPGARFKKRVTLSPQARAARAAGHAKRKAKGLPYTAPTKRNEILSAPSPVDNPENLPEYYNDGPGRIPLFIQKPDLKDRFFVLIRDGMPFTVACKVVGWSYDSVMNWLEKGHRGDTKEYYDFYVNTLMAEGNAESKVYKKLKKAHGSDWRAAAWTLERRWPERWSKHELLKQEVKVTNDTVITIKDELAAKVIDNDDARNLARAALSGGQPVHDRSSLRASGGIGEAGD